MLVANGGFVLSTQFVLQPILPDMPRPLPREHGYLEVVTQPVPNLRFRYESEAGKSHITGDGQNRPCPEIKVMGYEGEATLIASLVSVPQDGELPRPHPHRLEGQNAKNGVVVISKVNVTREQNIIKLEKVYLVAKRNNAKFKEWEPELEKRKILRIDPFKTGDKNPIKKIDRNYVQICFQLAFDRGGTWQTLEPVCSSPIHNSNHKEPLGIVKISPTYGLPSGEKRMIMLINGVTRKGEVKSIRFYDETGWKAVGIYRDKDIHETAAIKLVYPRYGGPLYKPHCVKVKLITDRGSSEPVNFTYVPDEQREAKKERRMKSMRSADSNVPSTVDDRRNESINYDHSLAKDSDVSSSIPSIPIQEKQGGEAVGGAQGGMETSPAPFSYGQAQDSDSEEMPLLPVSDLFKSSQAVSPSKTNELQPLSSVSQPTTTSSLYQPIQMTTQTTLQFPQRFDLTVSTIPNGQPPVPQPRAQQPVPHPRGQQPVPQPRGQQPVLNMEYHPEEPIIIDHNANGVPYMVQPNTNLQLTNYSVTTPALQAPPPTHPQNRPIAVPRRLKQSRNSTSPRSGHASSAPITESQVGSGKRNVSGQQLPQVSQYPTEPPNDIVQEDQPFCLEGEDSEFDVDEAINELFKNVPNSTEFGQLQQNISDQSQTLTQFNLSDQQQAMYSGSTTLRLGQPNGVPPAPRLSADERTSVTGALLRDTAGGLHLHTEQNPSRRSSAPASSSFTTYRDPVAACGQTSGETSAQTIDDDDMEGRWADINAVIEEDNNDNGDYSNRLL